MASSATVRVRLFDAHCHLQDSRIAAVAPNLIRTAMESGVLHFAVNGVSEKDWHLVKQMADDHPAVIPCFGLHPWFVTERSPNWMTLLKNKFTETPWAAVGEIGLDKGKHGKVVEFQEQVDVFQQQLELAKELERPVSVHCVRAFGDLLEILKRIGPFPAGVILHSFLGSAEMVPEFANLGSYFSFSGFLTAMNPVKAKKMLKSVPVDRILLETDAPDAFPQLDNGGLVAVPMDISSSTGEKNQHSMANTETSSSVPMKPLNHPANIHSVLKYVASLLEMEETELAEISYQNAAQLFTYPGSKIGAET